MYHLKVNKIKILILKEKTKKNKEKKKSHINQYKRFFFFNIFLSIHYIMLKHCNVEPGQYIDG